MKRILSISLLLFLFLSSTGCSQFLEEEREREIEANSSILVAYLSVTGHTEMVADFIAEDLQADVFRIEPEIPYTQDDLSYESTSRAMTEYLNRYEDRVALKNTTVPEWSNYDVIFLGYPIWFEDAAWPIYPFVEDNDFMAKTVIPFCTSNQNGIERSRLTLEKLAGTGVWEEGRRFSPETSAEEVKQWLNEIGY